MVGCSIVRTGTSPHGPSILTFPPPCPAPQLSHQRATAALLLPAREYAPRGVECSPQSDPFVMRVDRQDLAEET
jgi:hypothetical protein